MENSEENFINLTGRNEKIEELIIEIRLKADSLFERIPYDQFSNIEKINNSDDIAVTTWKNVPHRLRGNTSTKVVNLKYLYNSQDITPYEVRQYLISYKDYGLKIYGISQNPDTKDYILVIEDGYCKHCGEKYKITYFKWCKPCQIKNLKENFKNWTSVNEKIDEFIQEMQLKINRPYDIVFEWISYDQFSNIEEIGNTLYAALWINGPLEYDMNEKEWTRIQDRKVTLKQYNSQNTIDDFLNKVKVYESYMIYGISQNPDTKDYLIVLGEYNAMHDEYCNKCLEKYTEHKWCRLCLIKNLKENFRNWASGNETIDELIQEMQLKIDSSENTIFEWIPYNQLSNVKNIGINYPIATWKNGPLYYNLSEMKYTRNSDRIVSLKYLYDSHEVQKNRIKHYLNSLNEEFKIYGFSQNPDTGHYILVIQDIKYCEECGEEYTDMIFRWCKPCQIKHLKENFKNPSENNEVNKFIQEKQLEINDKDNIIFERIPYFRFSHFKEINSNSLIYSAEWTNGPLCWNKNTYKRDTDRLDRMVNLKLLRNSQNITNEFLNNEVKQYTLSFKENKKLLKAYGISQNSDTKDFFLVLQNGYCEECGEKYTEIEYKWCKPCQINYLEKIFTNMTSENEEIDNFIKDSMQLKINNAKDIVFEWIPYNQFNYIKNIGNKAYSALWEDGPLIYDLNKKKWAKEQAKEITLKYVCNSQNVVDEFLNKVKVYDEIFKLYGISQEPITKDYIMVLQKKYDENYCEKCIEKYTDIKYKWCKPCQMDRLKKAFTYWTSGNEKIDNFIQEMQLKINNPEDTIFEWISYDQFNDIKEIDETVYSALCKDGPLKFDSNKKKWVKVQAKEVILKLYNSQYMNNDFLDKVKIYNNIFKIHGITQNPDSKDYVMVLENYHKRYVKSYCETCIEEYTDTIFRWCKPCQIDYLRKNFTNWSGNEKIDEFIKEMQLKVNNPNDMINEFINEIRAYSMNKCGSNIIKIYGISRDPKTKNYIIVLQYAEGGNFNDWINKCYKDFDWNNKLRTLYNIIFGLNEIHQKEMVHRDFHTGNILFEFGYVNQYNDTYISDMGLCGEIGNVDKSKIYGVMSYVAPEVLRGKPYTKAADIYSFGMIMYFVATGRQPFSDRAHDEFLALDICDGISPEIKELEAPKCYVELMKRCWDLDPNNRPNAIEIESIVHSYNFSLNGEIKEQFKEAEEYRKENILSIGINRSSTHPQAINISRLLNPFTKDLPKCDKNDDHSECLDCAITKL
ncbi:unnamed protein product [Rhizophagus irregularis]|nr:unnamed protein product [Rhizophagus irregularis]